MADQEDSQAQRTQDQDQGKQEGPSLWQRIKQFNVRNKCESARKFFTSAILDHFQNKRLICAVNHQHGEDVRACNAETQGYSYHYITPSREFHMDVNESNKDIYLRIVKQTQDGEEEFEYIEKGEIAEEHADGVGSEV